MQLVRRFARWVFCRPSISVPLYYRDVFLPEDYPVEPAWQDRYYNEQYCLAAFLLGNRDYTVILPNYYLGKFRPAIINQHLDLSRAPVSSTVNFRCGASFWLQKCGGETRA